MNIGGAPRERELIEEGIKQYRAAHPGSPASVRRPRIARRNGNWTATLGSDGQCIVGSGPTVEEALRAFDTNYLSYLRN